MDAQFDPLIRLDMEEKAIGNSGVACRLTPTKDVGWVFELDHDFGASFPEVFARTEINRHAIPAPIIDEQF